jgi:Fic family protein
MKTPLPPPAWDDLLVQLLSQLGPDHLLRLFSIGPVSEERYRHWDTLRHIRPPEGFTTQEWWLALKLARRPLYRPVPLYDPDGRPFQYAMVDPVLERLSRIDREASGQIALPEQVTSRETRDRYIVNSLIEEAITSSQLEGAATTREVAKEMLRTGRNPVNRSERMILNNFQAIQYLREIKGESLTPALVIDLHRRITAGTLAPASDYFRKPGDGIGVYDNDTNQLLHRPPPAEEIPARLEALCRFANEGVSKGYLHPVLKAIILHFWLAYDHPFVDGNGRTARALFYCSMISQGYGLFEYVSISSILRKAPARYARAFLYTETDDNDLTYFLLAQLRVVEEAIAALHQYLQRKVQEVKTATALIKHREEFNHRQVALLSHALRHPGTVYTVESHRNSHNVSYQTARTDLLELAKKHLLKKGKRGKAFVFFAEFDLEGRLRRLA